MANIPGTTGDDQLTDTSDDDTIDALGGNDTITTTGGKDVVNGGTGTDTLVVNWSSSSSGASNNGTFQLPVVNSTEGGFDGGFFRNDMGEMRYTSIERFVVMTGSGADNIITATGNDIVSTGGGDDIVDVGSGLDQADGGSNADLSRGTDRISADMSGAATAILWNLEANSYSGPAGTSFTNFETFGTVRTGSGDDVLVTRNLAIDEIIFSGAGNDSITSRDGRDSVNGGVGTDTLVLDWSASNSGASNTNVGAAPAANGAEGGFNGRFLRNDLGEMTYTSIERFVITTGGGNDSIITASGDDVVNTGAGNDFVNFGSGNDQGDGGTGEDGFSADLSSAIAAVGINLQTGESLSFTNFEYVGTLTTGFGNDIVVTRNIARDEVINTGAGDDTITSQDGKDIVNGGTGTDTLVLDWSTSTSGADNSGPRSPAPNGTTGGFDGRFLRNDLGDMTYSSIERFVISTGSASDNITTASGDDEIRTGGSSDTINAGAGNDLLDGGAGSDTMIGGSGSDIYVVDNVGDVVTENANEGTDEVRTALAAYSIAALANVENLTGTAAVGVAQTLTGNSGNNVIDGGGGADAMSGGLGNDVYIVDNVGDSVTEAIGEGTDEVRTSLASHALGANVENLTGLSNAGQELTGNDLVNVITGAGGDDVIVAGAGNDQILAGAGNDDLDGGTGADSMAGGTGDDTYFVDSLADIVTEASDSGIDEVRTTTSYYYLSANVENLTGIRTNGLGQALTGNGLANVITGTDFSDRLDGGAGIDTLVGGAGDDIYIMDSGDGDTITEAVGPDAGNDTIETSLATFSLAGYANVENLTGTSDSGQALTGSLGDNRITGGTGNDILDGGGGTDALAGGGGDDIYLVDGSEDVVTEAAGEGEDEVRTSAAVYSIQSFANVENLSATSDTDHDFRGNSGDNVITGGGGNDFIRLQDGGDDSGVGGGGNDIFLFGATLTSADSADGGAGTDQAVIQGDYSAGVTLGSNLVGIESFAILSGSDIRFGDPGTNFYDYDLTTVEANVAAGVTMVVDANRLRLGEDFAFDGSAETDGAFFIYGGGGTDNLLGGSRNDVFYFGENGQFGSSDHVDGGAGGIDQLGLRGSYTITFGATQLVSIESIGLVSAQDTRFGALGTAYNYNLTMNDGNVAAGVRMTVDAAPLRDNETFRFDGSAESDGSFRIFGGQGVDEITGSQGNDIISGGFGSDTLRGGGGNDVFLYRNAGESTSAGQDGIQDFNAGDLISLSQIDADTRVAGDQAFHWIGSNAFTGTAGELRATANGNIWTVEGDVNGDGVGDIQFAVVVIDNSTHPLSGADFLL